MDAETIRAMEAGREMDELVACEVFGCDVGHWTDGSPYCRCPERPHTDTSTRHTRVYNVIPRYTTDIAAAWKVADKMAERGFGLTLYTPGAFTDDGLGPQKVFSAVFARESDDGALKHGRDWFGAYDPDSAPLAICRAALLAVEAGGGG